MAPWSVCQIAFAFGKLRIESSEAVPAMFGCIAERVADEEESLSRHLPTACSLVVSRILTYSTQSSFFENCSIYLILCLSTYLLSVIRYASTRVGMQ